jgi:beta-galactosidase
MDVAGVDIYHLSQDKLDGATIAFGGAVGRTLKKDNYLVLETQSQGCLSWLPYPGQLRLQAYSHLSSGANSVMYWNWHSIHNSFESYWKGVLSHDLKPNASYRELAAFRQEEQQIEASLLNLKKHCKAAIVVDNASLTGMDEFPISGELDYNHILRWIYDACYALNLECELLSVSDDFSAYPLLLVPALYSASEATLARLKSYVSDGGQLLLGFKSGFSDEELKIYADAQPHLLTDCIGAAYDQFTRPEGVSVSFPWEETSEKKSYQVSEWMELLRPLGAEVWADYTHPFWGSYAAVTHHCFGKGSATYLGCYMEQAGLQVILKRLCAESGIVLPDYTFPIIRKQGTNDAGKLITYFFNYSSAEQSFVSDVPDGTELLTGKACRQQGTYTLKPWDLMIVESGE